MEPLKDTSSGTPPIQDPANDTVVVANEQQPVATPTKKSSLPLYIMLVVSLLIIGGLVTYIYVNKDNKSTETSEAISTLQAVVSDAKDTTSNNNETLPAENKSTALDCGTKSKFEDKDFGVSFCYPVEWGNTSIIDAKVGPGDTGHRESIRFSANTLFAVGGTSEDWSTTVGRGVGCQEPNNSIPELSSYDTAWHNISGTGMDVEFAERSLPSIMGGYDITETVGNLMMSGVCVHGHKAINASRYRVFFEAYSRDFSEPAGISTPRAHMDNPNVLFSAEQRLQFDELLASAVAF